MGNNGKICVSVCAATADEIRARITRAEETADVIEIRFDCVEGRQMMKAIAFLASKKTLLLTFRPLAQGGRAADDEMSRLVFWRTFVEGGRLDPRKVRIDCEHDLQSKLADLPFQKIVSFHDFAGVPADLDAIYRRLSGRSAVAKIAVQAGDVTDTIPIWRLLKKAVAENQPIIPIAMGEAGKWTRILGLAHGADMTYASLDAGSETAPGQVSARDLTEVYRAKELDEATEIYGILGGNTSVSLSPYIHNAAFRHHDLNAVFVPLQARDLDAFIARMVRPATREVELDFKGFAVTIPHKESIMRHLDETDETARQIGAVNTVKIVDGRLHGYNTDAQGFIEPLRQAYGDLAGVRVAVLGAGGAARACIYALKRAGAEVTVFARDLEKAQKLVDDFAIELADFPIANRQSQIANHEVLVNTTPLGMRGKAEGVSPVAAADLAGCNFVYDLVYTPFQTPLMEEADRAEVPKIGGLAMLIAQAAAQQTIWTGRAAPLKEMSRAALERLK